MRLFFEHKGIFFDPRRDGAFSSYYKDSQFSLALFFGVFERQSILWKTAESSLLENILLLIYICVLATIQRQKISKFSLS